MSGVCRDHGEAKVERRRSHGGPLGGVCGVPALRQALPWAPGIPSGNKAAKTLCPWELPTPEEEDGQLVKKD